MAWTELRCGESQEPSSGLFRLGPAHSRLQ